MNKTLKTVLIVALCLFGFGIVVFFGASLVTGYSLSKLAGSADDVVVSTGGISEVVEKEFNSEKQDIEIDLSFADVTVGEAKDGKIHISYTDSTDASFELKETPEKIKLSQEQHVLSLLGSVGRYARVEVLIPKNHKGDLEIDTASGSLDIADITMAGDFDASTASGRVALEDCSFKESEISTASGDVDLAGLKSGSLDITTASGEIELTGLAAKGETELSSASGAVRLENSELGSLEISTHSGSIYFTDSAAKSCAIQSSSADCKFENGDIESLDITTIAGAVLGTLTGSSEDYRITSKTVSGFDSLRNVGGSGSRTLFVSTTSGNIELEFAN